MGWFLGAAICLMAWDLLLERPEQLARLVGVVVKVGGRGEGSPSGRSGFWKEQAWKGRRSTQLQFCLLGFCACCP
jgi:hypothetical protein